MAKCRKCGKEASGFIHCKSCRDKWKTRRMKVWNEALAIYGPCTAENHADIMKHVKEQEKKRPI